MYKKHKDTWHRVPKQVVTAYLKSIQMQTGLLTFSQCKVQAATLSWWRTDASAKKQEVTNSGTKIRVNGTIRDYASCRMTKGVFLLYWWYEKRSGIQDREGDLRIDRVGKTLGVSQLYQGIDTRYHFLREKVDEGQVVLENCSTKDMKTDLMTKPIPVDEVKHLRNMLGIRRQVVPSFKSVVQE